MALYAVALIPPPPPPVSCVHACNNPGYPARVWRRMWCAAPH